MMPPLLIIDIETYFDRAYSLRQLSLQEYINDARFHIHGIAVLHPDGRGEFRGDVERLLSELRAEYGRRLEKVVVVMHNAYFDYAVLHWSYGITISNIFDTMLASYHVVGRAGEGGERASLASLARAFGLTPKGDLHFMEGVWAPDPVQAVQLREYALNDVGITKAIAEELLPRITNTKIELPIMAHTVRMFAEGSLRVDAQRLEEALALVRDRLEAGLASLGLTEEDVSKNKPFTELLTQALARTGRSIPMKEGKHGPTPAIAKTDEAMLALAEDEDPVVQKLACLRLQKRSADQTLSRLEYLRRASTARKGLVSFQIIYHGSHTGRFAGGGGFNVQNIPTAKRAKTQHGRETATAIRRCLRAHDGQQLVAVDAAQIEARVLAWVAGQQDLLETFAAGRNVYAEFGTACLGREVRKPAPEDAPEDIARLSALYGLSKAAVLGLGYSMGVLRFKATLKMDPLITPLFDDGTLTNAVCAAIVYAYRERHPRIKELWGNCDEAFRRAIDGLPSTVGPMEFLRDIDTVIIRLPSTRELRYPGARLEPSSREIAYIGKDGLPSTFSTDRPAIVYHKKTRLYGGKITENIVQAIARDILVEVILRLERGGWPVCLHIHDEIVMQVDANRAEECKAAAVAALSTSPLWATDLPLAAEGGIGESLNM